VVTSSILQGRPYGGVAILINKVVASSLELKVINASERFIIISLGKTIFVNVYFPPTSSLVVTAVDTILNEISGILFEYQSSSLVFGGDLNTNIYVSSEVSVIIKSFKRNHCLHVVDDHIDLSSRLTYCHNTLNAKSYIDF